MACHKDTYVNRFRLVDKLRDKGCFVLNCSWTDEELTQKLPASLRKAVADKQADFYVIDAQAIARKVGLGVRVNMIMETVFFKLSEVMDFDTAVAGLKKEITAAYMHEGGDVVQKISRLSTWLSKRCERSTSRLNGGVLKDNVICHCRFLPAGCHVDGYRFFQARFGAVYQIGRECPACFSLHP